MEVFKDLKDLDKVKEEVLLSEIYLKNSRNSSEEVKDKKEVVQRASNNKLKGKILL